MKREASTHAQPAGLFRYRRLSSPKFLASNSQSFELRFRLRSPLASRVERLFATRSLHPVSSFRRCSFARPSASSITATNCVSTFVDLQPALVRSELSASSRVRTVLRLPFSDGTAGPNRCFKHPPSCEAFSFETQARAIQDISRSRASEFTPLENRRKRNKTHFCDYPVQNLSALWRRVDKMESHWNSTSISAEENFKTWLAA